MSTEMSLVARLAGLITATVLVQMAAVSQVSLLGSSADLTPLVVAAIGLYCGSLIGAVSGFGAGLFVDIVLLQSPGISSLTLLGVGYGAGRLRELRDPAHGLTPVLFGAGATAAAAAGHSLIQFLVGIDSPVSLLLIRDIVATVVVNAVISLPVFALVRRVLSGVVAEDPRRRRRRAYTTGGLSPISRP